MVKVPRLTPSDSRSVGYQLSVDTLISPNRPVVVEIYTNEALPESRTHIGIATVIGDYHVSRHVSRIVQINHNKVIKSHRSISADRHLFLRVDV